MKILLHACCGPCLTYPYRIWTERGYDVTVYFYNPNIHPFREYRERYFAILDYCEGLGAELVVGPYQMELFLARVSDDIENRCGRCFEMRLSRTAAEAQILGIGEFTTTLLVSPYQDHELIIEAGRAASSEHGGLFQGEDMRDGYRDSVEISRRYGMYRQSYCGCVYSEKERYQKNDPPLR